MHCLSSALHAEHGGPREAQRTPQGRIGGNAIGHFRVRARQLTPSAFNGSALPVESRRAPAAFVFGDQKRFSRPLFLTRMPARSSGVASNRYRRPAITNVSPRYRSAVLSSDPLSAWVRHSQDLLVLILVNQALTLSTDAAIIATIPRRRLLYRRPLRVSDGGCAYIVAKENLGECPHESGPRS